MNIALGALDAVVTDAPLPFTPRLALITRPLVEGVMDKEPDAWHRLRTAERALRGRREDRRRAGILHRLVTRLIEDHEHW
ncbi:hypothetical protein GCM10010420_32430 [Streptomyces glaucosporus]|uniref:Uncharacterized protein n=1 Tax=Streptomyces glaucosporus TaxID=284044 RepID=A0ABP5VGP4_9ACTN